MLQLVVGRAGSEGREAGDLDVEVPDVDVARHLRQVHILDGGDGPRGGRRQTSL